jgi:hypothetical protein
MTRSRDTADTQDNLGGAVAPFVAGKNAIINGGLDIWQRGTSFTSPASGTFTADRWNSINTGAATTTITRQTTSDTTNLPFIQYCIRYQRTSGQTNTGNLYLTYGMENSNSTPFIGKTVTVSFYARCGANFSPTSSVIQVRGISGTGTDQNINNGFTGNIDFISSTATLTTTWQRFTYTGTVSSSATQLGFYVFSAPTGTAGANDYYEVTGVQLELGAVATPFARAGGSIGGELSLCQRYYWKTANSAVTNANLGGNGFTYSTTAGAYWVNNPVAMRIVPSAVDAANLRVYDITGGAAYTATATISTDSTTINGVINFAVTGATANRVVRLDANTTGGYLGFSAEL